MRGIREAQGLTQEEFAQLLGIGRINYNAMERGRQAISFHTLKQYAQVLNTDYTQLAACKLADEFPLEVLQQAVEIHQSGQ